MEIVVAADAASAAAEAAALLARWIRAAVRARGDAHVAYSGGSTPALMLAALTGLDVPWQHAHAWQVDEQIGRAHV